MKKLFLFVAMLSLLIMVPSVVKAEDYYILTEDGTLIEDMSGNHEAVENVENISAAFPDANPSGVEWYDGWTTGVRFDREANKYYSVELYCNGTRVTTVTIPSVPTSDKCFVPVGIRFDSKSYGMFTATVYVADSSGNKISGGTTTAEEYVYVKPQKKVGTPSNLVWNGSVLSWSASSDMTGVQYLVYKKDSSSSTGNAYIGEETVENINNTLDLSDFFAKHGEGEYKVHLYGITNMNKRLKSTMAISDFVEYPNSPIGPIDPIDPVDPVIPEVMEFVRRLYTLVLNRAADETGLIDWSEKLINNTVDGFSIGYGFVFSDECKNRNLSNTQFVEIMYKTFLNRTADEAGKNTWVPLLDAGMDREYVFNGFVLSTEFASICSASGIKAGNAGSVAGFSDVMARYRNQNGNITQFVSRCYTKALGRERDIDGVEMWCRLIINKEWTPRNVAADGFFHSDEFINKNTSNSEYVAILYRTFLGRELDNDGYELWVGLLNRNEWTRDQVLDGFADSEEFGKILAGFGLN